MAATVGIAPSTVHKIWKAHGLKPHLVETFKLSRDPDFVDKVEDVVGLYLDPPDKALVLSVDEKSQIQALDRTQPGLPMKRGRAGTMTHDYKRHGTTTLFAALDVLTGMVIGECLPRHRHREFLRFLKRIDKETAADLDLHLILDNYATHKTAEVRRWLAAHPRFHLHFTPTSASWLNLVEPFFAEITEQRIRRGAFNSVAELEKAIMDYLEQHNANTVRLDRFRRGYPRKGRPRETSVGISTLEALAGTAPSKNRIRRMIGTPPGLRHWSMRALGARTNGLRLICRKLCKLCTSG